MTDLPFTLEQPLDVSDARIASRKLADQRRAAEKEHEALTIQAAEAEREYRKAYARAFIESDGIAEARKASAQASTADLSYMRDLKAGMVKVKAEQLRGLEGERSMLKSLIDWSARLDPFASVDRAPQR